MGELGSYLLELLREATATLPSVTERKIFSSQGFMVNGHAFVMVWKDRVVLRFPDLAVSESLLQVPGTATFDPMGKGVRIKAWLVAPESFHDDSEALADWVHRSYALVSKMPAKGLKPRSPSKNAAQKRSISEHHTAEDTSTKKPSAKGAAKVRLTAKHREAENTSTKRPSAKGAMKKKPTKRLPAKRTVKKRSVRPAANNRASKKSSPRR